MFSSFELTLGTSGFLRNLRGTAVNFITNTFSVRISLHCIFALFCTKIAAGAVDNGFLAGQQFWSHGDIVLIGTCYLELFVDRRQKLITRASVNIANKKWNEDRDCGPKVLGVFGSSYLWSVFQGIEGCNGNKSIVSQNRKKKCDD